MDHVLGCGSLWLMGKEDLDRGVVEAAVVTCASKAQALWYKSKGNKLKDDCKSVISTCEH